MTDNHKEFCEWLRREADNYHSAFLKAADLIESQAARIQQQALEYMSLFDQCSQHLARIAELEREKDEAEKHAAAVSSENFDLEARIAELDRKHKEAWDDCGELNTANHELLAACGEKDRRIAELEKERDALKADAERYVWAISSIDNAESLWAAVMSCGPSARESINIEIDAALQAEKETR